MVIRNNQRSSMDTSRSPIMKKLKVDYHLGFPPVLMSKMNCCRCPITQSCPTLCDPMDCSTPASPVRHSFLELLKFMSIESTMPPNHPILCCPLLLLPSIFPSLRVFSKALALQHQVAKVSELQIQHQSFQ